MRSRSKIAILNICSSCIQELVVIVCGFILPRLILSQFGSTYNGLLSAISQFLGCAVLFRAGIGGATRAALYKPLADGNMQDINSIMSATDRFMKKVGVIIIGMILFFACIYPLFVSDEFGWLFTFSLFLVIGVSTFAESFFGITYLTLLHADQKIYIASIFEIVVYICNTLVAAVLIKNNASIHIVKLGSSMVFTIYPIVLSIYVKKKYRINTKIKSNNNVIKQRWDAFFHQIANFVMTNTDIIVLSIFLPLSEVSVYAVYNLIINGLRKMTQKLLNVLEPLFGNIIAKDQENILKDRFYMVECVVFDFATIIFSCTSLLIVPFVLIYTSKISDANYNQPIFAIVIVIAQFFNCVRQPYQMLVQAVGHYKQTKKGAILEPIINIVISVVLVYKIGLVGVAIGTLAATLFRTVQYSLYVFKYILKDNAGSLLKNILVSLLECAIILIIYRLIVREYPSSYLAWGINAVISGAIAVMTVSCFSYIFFRKQLLFLFKKVFGRVNKRKI